MIKRTLKAKILDFKLATSAEICEEIGKRLKTQRLLQRLKQQELADRAGIAVATVKNLESKGHITLETLIRVAMTLGLIQDLEQLFNPKIQSIALMEKIEELESKQIPRRIR